MKQNTNKLICTFMAAIAIVGCDKHKPDIPRESATNENRAIFAGEWKASAGEDGHSILYLHPSGRGQLLAFGRSTAVGAFVSVKAGEVTGPLTLEIHSDDKEPDREIHLDYDVKNKTLTARKGEMDPELNLIYTRIRSEIPDDIVDALNEGADVFK